MNKTARIFMRVSETKKQEIQKAAGDSKSLTAFVLKAATQFMKYRNLIEVVESSGLKMSVIKQRIRQV